MLEVSKKRRKKREVLILKLVLLVPFFAGSYNLAFKLDGFSNINGIDIRSYLQKTNPEGR